MFLTICGSRESKSRLAKAAGAETCGQMGNEKLHAAVGEASFGMKSAKAPHARSTVAKHCVSPIVCGSRGSKSRLAKMAGEEPSSKMRDEKLHTALARSRFTSQNEHATP